MKLNKRHIPFVLYLLFTILIVLLWAPIPNICHFIGASSLIYTFLFAVGDSQQLLAFLALAWIPVFIVNLVIWFVFALKREKYLPFYIVVACDLFVSLLIIGSKIQTRNYCDLGIALLGYSLRLGYFVWMLYFTRNTPTRLSKTKQARLE